jgi:crotonobetainyl-CoA:carnitine CoA-transferase CaiB-like acyl-CoA transferase
MPSGNSQCLKGLKVVEMSRVIAAPLCGKTLAAHGADVTWVTSPNLPEFPTMDRDFGRGKRTVHIDIHKQEDKDRLIELIRTCGVFVQGFRPSSLARYGLSPQEILKINPTIIMANMSAFGPRGPWAGRRGYDSLVQTCSGMNVSEAEHAGKDEVAKPTPCRALDHAGGYYLATGVIAAVYRRALTPGFGAWRVDVSLAGVMKYFRSMGQYPGAPGFESKDYEKPSDVPPEFFETRNTGFGLMEAIKHSATVEGCSVGWDVMPKPLGFDRPEWL